MKSTFYFGFMVIIISQPIRKVIRITCREIYKVETLMQNSYERPKKRIHVQIQNMEGETTKCFLVVNINEQLHENINGTNIFLELEDELGQKSYMNKNALMSIEEVMTVAEVVEVEGSRMVGDTSSQFFSTDPYIVLGVHRKAGDEEVRSAYHQLARNYHRDRLAAANLPPEMMIHAEEVLKRITSAYDIVSRERKGAA